MAAPLTGTAISDSRAEIQAVIDALKVQVNAFNPSAASLVDDIEDELTRSGVLSEENIKLLDDKIKVRMPLRLLIQDTCSVADNKSSAY